MTPPEPTSTLLAEALGDLDDIAGSDRIWRAMSAEVLAARILAHLPAPFAIVDMTAWRALADEARLVSQWHDAVDPMPDELRAELRDLGVSARRLLAIPEAQEDDRE